MFVPRGAAATADESQIVDVSAAAVWLRHRLRDDAAWLQNKAAEVATALKASAAVEAAEVAAAAEA
eukprot:5374801-Prymnesium_polylepis.1